MTIYDPRRPEIMLWLAVVAVWAIVIAKAGRLANVDGDVRELAAMGIWLGFLGRPWTLHVKDGGSYHFRSRGAAARYLAAGIDDIDIGCMQVNWHWHRNVSPRQPRRSHPSSTSAMPRRCCADTGRGPAHGPVRSASIIRTTAGLPMPIAAGLPGSWSAATLCA